MIKPTIIGDCHLYHADTMEILPQLIAEGLAADLVVCDPPYELTSGGCTKGGLHERFGNGKGNYGNSGNLFEGEIPKWPEFVPLFYQCLKSNAHCYMMADGRNQFDMQLAAREAGFRHHNLLVWDKVTATPNKYYMKNCEFTGFFFKGKAFKINECGSMAGVRLPHRDDTPHPTEKPIPLMEYYIGNSSKEGELVIDPFMGVGSTGIAALRLGRKFIGIERDAQWFDLACERITEVNSQLQLKLF